MALLYTMRVYWPSTKENVYKVLIWGLKSLFLYKFGDYNP